MQIDGVNIPEDENGNLYCICGYKPNSYNYTPSSVDKCKHYLLLEDHFPKCNIWNNYVREVKRQQSLRESVNKNKINRRQDDSIAHQKKFEIKLLIGWLMIILGLVLMFALGVSSSHQFAWVGLAIIGLGFFIILGFWGLIGTIFGSLFDSAIHTSNLHDLAKDVSITQAYVERRNLMFDRDVLGQKIDNTFKRK